MMEEENGFQHSRDQTPDIADLYRGREGNKTPGEIYQNKPADIDELYQSVSELYTPDTPTQGAQDNYKSLQSWTFSPIPNTGIHLCQPPSATTNDYSLTDHYGNTEWAYPMYNWYYAANYMHSKSNVEAEVTKPEPVTMPFYNMPSSSSSGIDRCSTPELISVLANISEKQEPKPSADKASGRHYYYSHSSSMCSSQNASMMYLQMAGCYQDSGYSSDLNMSPVYPYQQHNNSTSKMAANVSKVDSSDEENKENVAAVNNLRFDQFDRTEVTHEMASSSALNLATYSDTISRVERQIQSSDISSSDLAAKNLSKIAEATLKLPCKLQTSLNKRKITETVPYSVKRQRHNQPLNNDAIRVMMQWYETHQDSPYPNKAEKEQMAMEGGISVTQVKSWFANKRNRNNNTRPKVQKRQMEERLLDICHQLARDAKNPSLNNADIIQQLSTIIATPNDM